MGANIGGRTAFGIQFSLFALFVHPTTCSVCVCVGSRQTGADTCFLCNENCNRWEKDKTWEECEQRVNTVETFEYFPIFCSHFFSAHVNVHYRTQAYARIVYVCMVNSLTSALYILKCPCGT